MLSRLRLFLSERHPAATVIFASTASFLTYSCMYAFRKPFTAATFEGQALGILNYKDALVIAQLLGYTLSKFIGIKMISEMRKERRAFHISRLILIALLALLFFAITPSPYNTVFMFLNGVPLGMVWGITFSYLEGRKSTEVMGAVMAISFIFSSGFVKSAGKMLLLHGTPENWMPFLTALMFFVPMLFFILLLEQIPGPTPEDVAQRKERPPLSAADRKAYLKAYWPGIVLLITAYVCLSVLRDFRDSFAADIWAEQGYNGSALFTQSEIPVALSVLIVMGVLVVIRNNFRALLVSHLLVGAGFLVIGLSTWLFTINYLTAFQWMVANGIGLYLGYVPFNVVLFERKIAALRKTANVGFLMYLADSFGYLGSIIVVSLKNFSVQITSYSSFFETMLMVSCFSGIVLISASSLYFYKKVKFTHE